MVKFFLLLCKQSLSIITIIASSAVYIIDYSKAHPSCDYRDTSVDTLD